MALRTTAFINLKGGVGKTTSAINVAAILARLYEKRVLLIDADSQCNTTNFFGIVPKSGTIADLLRADTKLAGILPTMYYDSEENKAAMAALVDSGLHVFPRIRLSKPAEKMTWKQTPIIECSPRSAAAIDYRKFAAEYVGGVKNG